MVSVEKVLNILLTILYILFIWVILYLFNIFEIGYLTQKLVFNHIQLIYEKWFFYISGMIASAIAWGYIADTRGRKAILVWGLLADVICVLCCAMSQSILQLMIGKFIGGLV